MPPVHASSACDVAEIAAIPVIVAAIVAYGIGFWHCVYLVRKGLVWAEEIPAEQPEQPTSGETLGPREAGDEQDPALTGTDLTGERMGESIDAYLQQFGAFGTAPKAQRLRRKR